MLCDCHLHTEFSADSDAPVEDVIRQGITLGMSHMCITDHHDIDYDDLEEHLDFLLNPSEYYQTLSGYRERYREQIHLLIGVEMGLQPHLKTEVNRFIEAIPLDFVIGSSHVIDGIDPYYHTLWEQYSDEEVMTMYFENIYQNIQIFDNFDVYGHLDYAIRYAKQKDHDYHYEKYREILDEILKTLIRMDKGIEINTAGLRKGLCSTNPSEEIIKHYKEYGGKIITVGSDAHSPGDIGAGFERASQILKKCGFKEYYIFEQRKPKALPL